MVVIDNSVIHLYIYVYISLYNQFLNSDSELILEIKTFQETLKMLTSDLFEKFVIYCIFLFIIKLHEQ